MYDSWKLCVLLSLTVLFVSSGDAFPSNYSSDMKEGDLVGVVEAKEKLFKLGMLSEFSNTDSKVLTNWNDMYVAGLTTKVIQDGYQRKFGVRPDNQHLNDDFAHQWGWYSYNLLGDISITNVNVQPKSSVSNERYLTNDGDTDVTHSITLTSKVSNSATTTVTSKSEISTTASITVGVEELGLGASFSETFTFSNEVGSSHTQSTDITVGDTVSVTVPPHSKKRVCLQVTWTSKTADWEIPVTIDPQGWTGVDFHKRVEGHYYWGVQHAVLADPPFKSIMRGRLDASYDTKGTIIVEDAVAL